MGRTEPNEVNRFVRWCSLEAWIRKHIIGMLVCVCLAQGRISVASVSFDKLCGWSFHSRYDRLIAYILILAALGMVIGETKAFMVGRDFVLAHPGLYEGLTFALGYTLYNQQLLSWLACLLVLSIPFWPKQGLKIPD